MGDQQYILHLNPVFVPPIKPGRSPAYPLNPMHGEIASKDWHCQNNVCEYHLIKNMKSALTEIFIAAIDEKCTNGTKYTVMGYTNKSFVELMDWLHVRYGQVMPGYLIRNQ